MASIFSNIISGNIPCYKIAEDENYFSFLDISPLTKGHTLVVPKKEIDYIFDIFPHILNLAEIILRTKNLHFIKLIKIIQNNRDFTNFIFCLNNVVFNCSVNRKKIIRKRYIKVITNKNF